MKPMFVLGTVLQCTLKTMGIMRSEQMVQLSLALHSWMWTFVWTMETWAKQASSWMRCSFSR